jgi:hypothetical protein
MTNTKELNNKRNQRETTPKGPAFTLSTKAIRYVFKYQPTAEDRAIKKMLASLNY